MPVTIKGKAKETTQSVADLLKLFQKDHGEEIGSFGGGLLNADRIPTGIFELDLALGGGFPRGRTSMVYGPESSNKTNLFLLAIAHNQMLWPELTNVFVDVEHSLDPAWATKLGVNTEKLVVLRPSYAEQAVDMIESMLHAENCGMVIVDSLAALLTTSEQEKSAEVGQPGGAAKVISALYRRTTNAMQEAAKRERYPTLGYINQITFKIGGNGNPETTSGGPRPWYQSSIVLRVYGKNIMDPKFSKAIPVRKHVNYIVKKYKCPVFGMGGEFEMAVADHGNLKIGQSNDFNALSGYLKSFGMFEKDAKKGWVILGQHYPVIDEFRDKVYADEKFGTAVRQEIIGRLSGNMLIPGEGEEAPAVYD